MANNTTKKTPAPPIIKATQKTPAPIGAVSKKSPSIPKSQTLRGNTRFSAVIDESSHFNSEGILPTSVLSPIDEQIELIRVALDVNHSVIVSLSSSLSKVSSGLDLPHELVEEDPTQTVGSSVVFASLNNIRLILARQTAMVCALQDSLEI